MEEFLQYLTPQANLAVAVLTAVILSFVRTGSAAVGEASPKGRRITIALGTGTGIALAFLYALMAKEQGGPAIQPATTVVTGLVSGILGAGGQAWVKGLAGK